MSKIQPDVAESSCSLGHKQVEPLSSSAHRVSSLQELCGKPFQPQMGHVLTKDFSTAILFHRDCEEDEDRQCKLAVMQTDLVIL